VTPSLARSQTQYNIMTTEIKTPLPHIRSKPKTRSPQSA